MASSGFTRAITKTVAFIIAVSVATIAFQPGARVQSTRVQGAFFLSSTRVDLRIENLDTDMVFVPAGAFVMGSQDGRADEQPQHRVFLDAYWIDRYEVTNAQYRRFVMAERVQPPRYWSGQEYPPGQDWYPVVGVSWVQAQAYCVWRQKRLPTEAEWEKACRGGLEVSGVSNPWPARRYPWGDDWDPDNANTGYRQADDWPLTLDDAWSGLTIPNSQYGFPSLALVGSFSTDSSPYGIFDLAGNVSEWGFDWYNWEGYASMSVINPLSLGPPWNHVVRGGAWMDRRGQESFLPLQCRCSARSSSHSFDDPRIGFRCARSAH